MKRKRIIIIVIISVIVLSNITPFRQILKISIDERHYRYSNYNGSFTFYEFMDRNFEMMKRMHNVCLSNHANQKDKNVYRLFSKNPLAFWRWWLYFSDERYKLPYKDWTEIQKTRGSARETTGCTLAF